MGISYNISGWCLEHVVHILGTITPTDELIFFRGVGIPLTNYDYCDEFG